MSLAIVLINKPDVLMLDEPTNHGFGDDRVVRDILQEELPCLVTHDRYFLERVCTEIMELDQGELYRYKGNYSYFLEKKEERIAQEASSVKKAKNLFKRELDWMRRQPKARTTKSKSRIDDFHVIKQHAKKRGS